MITAVVAAPFTPNTRTSNVVRAMRRQAARLLSWLNRPASPVEEAHALLDLALQYDALHPAFAADLRAAAQRRLVFEKRLM